jgi:hypothetical protein
MFDYDTPVDESASDAVVADIRNAIVPAEEPAEVRTWRILEHELREERDRELRRQSQARYEFEQARERERQQQAAHAEARRAWREKVAQQDREREAQLDRQRIAALVQHRQAEQVQRVQAARAKAVNDYWREVDQLVLGLDRLCTPAQPDYTAQRVAMLEDELRAQADQAAADAERQRSARYQQSVREAVAKREAGGGWR